MFHWDDAPELNITPLVDVMLVLMAILMITAPTITYQEKITLPTGSKSTKLEKPKALTIRMDGEKVIYFKNSTFKLDTFADDFLNQSASLNKSATVYIRADELLTYGDVMHLLKSVKASGFQNVSLLTQ
jgi:biopolymer transport protein ExbD